MQDQKNRVAIVELCLFVFVKGLKKYIILKEGRADVTEERKDDCANKKEADYKNNTYKETAEYLKKLNRNEKRLIIEQMKHIILEK